MMGNSFRSLESMEADLPYAMPMTSVLYSSTTSNACQVRCLSGNSFRSRENKGRSFWSTSLKIFREIGCRSRSLLILHLLSWQRHIISVFFSELKKSDHIVFVTQSAGLVTGESQVK